MADDIDIDAIEDAGLLDGLEGEARAERAELIEWLLAEGFTLRHIHSEFAPMLMPAGRASIASVADSLGITVRTLQRRLEDDGTQFSDLLDRVRVREVSRYLGQRRLRLTDVADALGYSSLSAFSNWYRGRFGESPRDARKHEKPSAPAR